MSRHFLLDGYNLTHQMSGFAGRSLEGARNGLIALLKNQRPQGSCANRVTVVFDGREDVFHLQAPDEIRVLFSRGETADDLIKRLIGDETSPRTMVLVTDDRELRDFARGHGVGLSSVTEFLARASRVTVKPGRGVDSSDHKVIPEVFKSRVNKELGSLWLKE